MLNRPVSWLLLLAGLYLLACPATGTPQNKDDKADAGTADSGGGGSDGSLPMRDGSTAGNPLLTQSCPGSQETNACWKCEDENCCDTYAACSNNSACQDLKNCVRNCENAADYNQCTSDCENQNLNGLQDWLNRMACVEVLCPVVCSEASAACHLCYVDACANDMSLCLANHACAQAWRCMGGCADDDTACWDNCAAQYPTGQAVIMNFITCVDQHCASDCG